MRSYSALVEKEPCRVECSALFYRAIAPIRSPEYYLADARARHHHDPPGRAPPIYPLL